MEFICYLSAITGAILILSSVYLLYMKKITLDNFSKNPKLDTDALKAEISENIKISTNVPALGLFVIGFILIAIALYTYPNYTINQNLKIYTINLSGTFEREFGTEVSIRPENIDVQESGSFTIPIIYESGLQKYSFLSENYYPITLSITLDKIKNELTVSSNYKGYEEKLKINMVNKYVELKNPIKFEIKDQYASNNDIDTLRYVSLRPPSNIDTVDNFQSILD